MKTGNVWIAIALITAAACGGSSSTGTQTGVNTNPPPGGISVTNDVFTPATKTVAVGTTVDWAWNTCTGDGYSVQTCYQHSVTWDDGTGSATQDQGTYSKMFAAAGTYNYHCLVHPTMTGIVIVQ
jgi:plastocyanin